MKKLSRPILAIILACVMLISTTVISFAVEEGDPGGKCSVYLPPIINQYNIK